MHHNKNDKNNKQEKSSKLKLILPLFPQDGGGMVTIRMKKTGSIIFKSEKKRVLQLKAV